MTVTTRIQPIDRDLVIRLVGSPQERTARFAAFAREKLAEAQATNQAVLGHVPPHRTFVDGAEGGAEESVRPDGVIVYEFELVTDVLGWIGEQLELHSPVGAGADPHPGLYKRSHALFADGEEVPAGAQVPQATEYVFLDLQPYARKIEKTASVYQGVAAMASARFGNQARIVFLYFSAPAGAVGAYAASAAAHRNAARHSRHGAKADQWLTRQPAIAVRPR